MGPLYYRVSEAIDFTDFQSHFRLATPSFNYDDLGSEWYKLMDYYSDELAEFFYTFDSYDELLELIKLDVETLDSKNIRVKGPEKFKQMQKQALIQWSRIFIK